MSLTVFIGNKNYSSSSMRAGVLLRAFEIDVQEKFIRFDSFAPGSAFKRQVAEFSPAGSVPFIIDDAATDASGKPLVIWDTLAIIEYLAERFSDHPIWPVDAALRARARSLCAEMHCGFSALRSHCIMQYRRGFVASGAYLVARSARAAQGYRADRTGLRRDYIVVSWAISGRRFRSN